MNTQVHLSQQQHISLDTCVCQQLVVGCVRPEQLPGHFKFRHSSSLQVTFYTLHIPKVYSNLEVIQGCPDMYSWLCEKTSSNISAHYNVTQDGILVILQLILYVHISETSSILCKLYI